MCISQASRPRAIRTVARILHTSPEYAMKRLLAAGCGDIWQICKVYRDGERGRWHNPEFTLIEWYRLGVDHHALMSDVERLIGAMLPPARHFDRAERTDLSRSRCSCMLAWTRSTILRPCWSRGCSSAGIEMPTDLRNDRDALPRPDHEHAGRARSSATIGSDVHLRLSGVAGRAGAACAARSPRASRRIWTASSSPTAFTNSATPHEQRARFEQRSCANAHDAACRRMPIDEHFLAALEHGLPECSGVALGFDRLVMCAVGARSTSTRCWRFPFDRA